nr:ATP-binding cassette domain-containing protein [bacterium]
MLIYSDVTITLQKNLRPLVEHFSFSLMPGDRAAIIGEEGNGKSTLLKAGVDTALIGAYASVEGSIARGQTHLGYLQQELPLVERQKDVYTYLSEGALNDRTPGEVHALARSMGLDAGMFYSAQVIDTLSGGEKVKLQLARILLGNPQALLLDEPSNDIDMDTWGWLEHFLLTCGLPVVYISHDEALIERTANVIIHLEQTADKSGCRHTIARVPYGEYIRRRAGALAHQEQVAKKQQADYQKQMQRWRQIYEKVQHQQATISRADPGGGRLLKKKMKAVKSQQKRYDREKENFTQMPDVQRSMVMSFEPAPLPAGKRILSLCLPELALEGRRLCGPIRLDVRGGEHIAIIGKNGVGKTTLLRHILGQLSAGKGISLGYMPQQYEELLPLDRTPVDFLAPAGDKAGITRARTYLGSMQLTRDEMAAPIAGLSGGQKAKLLLLKTVLDGNNVLVLDEPTRNFSPISGLVIRRQLRDFEGTLIVTTHDRKLMETMDTLYRLGPDGLTLV